MLALTLFGEVGCKESPHDTLVVLGANQPSQVLRGFRMQDIQGGIKVMTLESAEARMLEAQHRTDLEKPVVKFFKEGSVSSVLTAPKGQVDMETREVMAWGGVQVVTTDSTTLTTDRLRYDPQKRKLLSDDAVRLDKTDSITDGTGLEAEPDLSRVKIGHEHVHFKK